MKSKTLSKLSTRFTAYLLTIAVLFSFFPQTALAVAPIAPSSVTAVSTPTSDCQSIDLSWTDNSSDEGSFRIYLKNVDGSYTFRENIPANTTTKTIISLICGQTYTYAVSAWKSGTDNESAKVDSNPAMPIMTAPTNLSVTLTQPSSAVLTWIDGSSSNKNGYLIERKTDYEPWKQIGTALSTKRTFTDPNCYKNETFTYRIRSKKDVTPIIYTLYSSEASINNPASPTNLQWVSQVPALGTTYKVQTQDNYAYVTHSLGFSIVNIADPEHPVITGSLLYTGVNNITLDGNGYAYLTGKDDKLLKIVNIADSANPVQVAQVTLPDAGLQVAVSNGNVFVACYSAGLVKVDVSNPLAPGLAQVYADTPGKAYDVKISGNTAFVADDLGGFSSISLVNPSTGTILSTIPTPTYGTQAIDINGNYAYVASGYSGLKIINITDPNNLTQSGQWQTKGGATGVDYFDGHAYISSFEGLPYKNGLEVVNVADPASLTSSFLSIWGTSSGLAVKSGLAIFCGGTGGLSLVNTSDPASPVVISRYSRVGNLSDAPGLAVLNSTIFALSYQALSVYGYNPEDIVPKPIDYGQLELSVSSGIALEVIGGKTYVFVTDKQEFKVIEYNPTTHRLSHVATLALPDSGYRISISGGKAYVGCNLAGMVIVDVSVPTSPSILGSYDTVGQAYSVAVTGTTAVVADGTNGIVTFDVSNPESPQKLATLPITLQPRDVKINGTEAWVTSVQGKLSRVNISTPNNPIVTNSANINYPQTASGVALAGDYVLVSSNGSTLTSKGLRLFKAESNGNITSLGFISTPLGSLNSVATSGQHIFVSDDKNLVDIAHLHAKELSLVKSVDNTSVASGDTVNVTLTMKNVSSNALHNLLVNDPILAQTSYVAGSAKVNDVLVTDADDIETNTSYKYKLNDGVPTWDFGGIVPKTITGDTITLTYQVTVNSDATPTPTNAPAPSPEQFVTSSINTASETPVASETTPSETPAPTPETTSTPEVAPTPESTPTDTPAPATAPTRVTQNDSQGTVAYQTAKPITSEIEYGPFSSKFSQKAPASSKDTKQNIQLPNLKSRTYYYRIATTDDKGGITYSKEYTLKHGNPFFRFFGDLWERFKGIMGR